jgi:hypothetical protein
MVDIEYETLLDDYADQIIEGMDMKTLYQLAYDMVRANLSDMDRVDVIEEVKNNAPHLIEE